MTTVKMRKYFFKSESSTVFSSIFGAFCWSEILIWYEECCWRGYFIWCKRNKYSLIKYAQLYTAVLLKISYYYLRLERKKTIINVTGGLVLLFVDVEENKYEVNETRGWNWSLDGICFIPCNTFVLLCF